MQRMHDERGRYEGLIAYQGEVWGTKGWTKRDDLTHRITHVKIHSSDVRRVTMPVAVGGTIFATATAGIFGLIAAAIALKPDVTTDLTIYLDDGSEIELHTDDKNLIRTLQQYMHVRGRR